MKNLAAALVLVVFGLGVALLVMDTERDDFMAECQSAGYKQLTCDVFYEQISVHTFEGEAGRK